MDPVHRPLQERSHVEGLHRHGQRVRRCRDHRESAAILLRCIREGVLLRRSVHVLRTRQPGRRPRTRMAQRIPSLRHAVLRPNVQAHAHPLAGLGEANCSTGRGWQRPGRRRRNVRKPRRLWQRSSHARERRWHGRRHGNARPLRWHRHEHIPTGGSRHAATGHDATRNERNATTANGYGHGYGNVKWKRCHGQRKSFQPMVMIDDYDTGWSHLIHQPILTMKKQTKH
mmetsp:Transcript_6616/g.19407  ORF Transcript_6616/g.19407 Transcript_6616/m.19407 type:complete len:228 (-) Transcript_6616:75-758(-)